MSTLQKSDAPSTNNDFWKRSEHEYLTELIEFNNLKQSRIVEKNLKLVT